MMPPSSAPAAPAQHRKKVLRVFFVGQILFAKVLDNGDGKVTLVTESTSQPFGSIAEAEVELRRVLQLPPVGLQFMPASAASYSVCFRVSEILAITPIAEVSA